MIFFNWNFSVVWIPRLPVKWHKVSIICIINCVALSIIKFACLTSEGSKRYSSVLNLLCRWCLMDEMCLRFKSAVKLYISTGSPLSFQDFIVQLISPILSTKSPSIISWKTIIRPWENTSTVTILFWRYTTYIRCFNALHILLLNLLLLHNFLSVFQRGLCHRYLALDHVFGASIYSTSFMTWNLGITFIGCLENVLLVLLRWLRCIISTWGAVFLSQIFFISCTANVTHLMMNRSLIILYIYIFY